MGQAHPGLSFFAKAVHLRAVTGVAALPYVDKGAADSMLVKPQLAIVEVN